MRLRSEVSRDPIRRDPDRQTSQVEQGGEPGPGAGALEVNAGAAQVTVNEPRGVGGGEDVRDLPDDLQRLAGAERAVPFEPFLQRLAARLLLDDDGGAVDF